jgi:alkylation response protein AidB-like acyl-CoA dehydrogenase
VRFVPTEEQADFVRTLDQLLAGADTVAAARAWAEGEHSPGLEIWNRLAGQGLQALLVPEKHDGLGATPVELVLALEVLGRHAVPGPYVEAAAFLAVTDLPEVQQAVAAGAVATVAAPPHAPYALDADVADHVLVAGADGPVVAPPDAMRASVDRTRRLFEVQTAGDAPTDHAFDAAVLATAAQLLGAGERILADSVEYVQQRRQFGREIGSYQAIKHALADVRIGLDFARPLVHGAALETDPATRARAVSAAKVAAGEAAYLASRTGLQVHGAIGYTAEHDLSLWVTKVRALVTAWGTPAWHRARVLESLVGAR